MRGNDDYTFKTAFFLTQLFFFFFFYYCQITYLLVWFSSHLHVVQILGECVFPTLYSCLLKDSKNCEFVQKCLLEVLPFPYCWRFYCSLVIKVVPYFSVFLIIPHTSENDVSICFCLQYAHLVDLIVFCSTACDPLYWIHVFYSKCPISWFYHCPTIFILPWYTPCPLASPTLWD